MKNIHELEIKQMLRMADDAKSRAYSPYSNFKVGACVKAASGAYYLGCNIENAAYSQTNCAERTAMFKAIYEGERDIEAIAIVSDSDSFTMPCGACRQVLSEFCDPKMPVICASKNGKYSKFTLGELLPHPFRPGAMNK